MESYKPADVTDLLARIPPRQQALEGEINKAFGPKPFFDGRVQEMHGGERDQRRQDDVRMSAKENEFEFLGRLQQILSS